MLFIQPRALIYRGDDRRGIIARLADPATSRLAAWMIVTLIVVPLAGMGLASVAPGLPDGAASVGAGDAALVAFVAAALVLLLRWRLVGEAAAAPLAAVSATAGLIFVPATHLVIPASGYAAALQTTSVLVMVGLCLAALSLPEVSSGLRPIVIVVSAIGAALVLAVPLSFALGAVGLQWGTDRFIVATAIEGLASAAVAVALLGRGIRGRKPLFAAAGAAVLAIAADSWALSFSPLAGTGPWTVLPSLFLLVGAVALLLATCVDLRSAFSAIVLDDVRGRRRWVAAETELARVSSSYRGQSHDLASMLSAVDGTLLALSAQRDQLSPEKSTQLLVAVRGQIQQLMSLLAEDRASAGSYDLSELLAGIVAIRASNSQAVRSTVEPGLVVPGHPDRVLRIVNNLLVNAAVHAPSASVSLTARRVLKPSDGDLAELIVADDGPGLTDAELERALEPGWRGNDANRVPGSGLGLFQCRELAEAEGGEIILGPTDPAGTPGERGLTAMVRIPVHSKAHSPGPRSSILQMYLGHDGAINGDVGSGRSLNRHSPGAEAAGSVRLKSGTRTTEGSKKA